MDTEGLHQLRSPVSPTESHTWLSSIGHVVISLTLSAYPNGQPCLVMTLPDGYEPEELTICTPGFDLRSFDADFWDARLHLVFRSLGRAQLLAGCGIVNLTPHTFRIAASNETALQLVWLQAPSWSRIRKAVVA